MVIFTAYEKNNNLIKVPCKQASTCSKKKKESNLNK